MDLFQYSLLPDEKLQKYRIASFKKDRTEQVLCLLKQGGLIRKRAGITTS